MSETSSETIEANENRAADRAIEDPETETLRKLIAETKQQQTLMALRVKALEDLKNLERTKSTLIEAQRRLASECLERIPLADHKKWTEVREWLVKSVGIPQATVNLTAEWAQKKRK